MPLQSRKCYLTNMQDRLSIRYRESSGPPPAPRDDLPSLSIYSSTIALRQAGSLEFSTKTLNKPLHQPVAVVNCLTNNTRVTEVRSKTSVVAAVPHCRRRSPTTPRSETPNSTKIQDGRCNSRRIL